LAAVPGVNYYALQLPADPETPDWMADLSPRIRDFDDTAAILQQLDLLITSDTAIAHLAGAMGRPVWLLLSRAADWRWRLEGTDSAWYPSMRLFRQPSVGDWPSVVAAVERALRARAAEPRRADAPAVC
jgi:ADP-heptose:LPS heptosyltransferase